MFERLPRAAIPHDAMTDTLARRAGLLRYALLAGLFPALLALSGCRTTYPPPSGEMSASRAAIATAEEAGASEHAPVELRRARQKAEQAQQAMDRGDNLRARILAEQAEVDARLAEATARAQRQQEAVDILRASIESLRQEIERSRAAGTR